MCIKLKGLKFLIIIGAKEFGTEMKKEN